MALLASQILVQPVNHYLPWNSCFASNRLAASPTLFDDRVSELVG
jgi:hypothetical protein